MIFLIGMVLLSATLLEQHQLLITVEFLVVASLPFHVLCNHLLITVFTHVNIFAHSSIFAASCGEYNP